MPNHKTHCQSCKKLYNKSYTEVHKWMDKPAEKLGPAHQKKRHDIRKTPEKVGEKFGKDAKIAARDHILLDMKWGETPKVSKRNVNFPQ